MSLINYSFDIGALVFRLLPSFLRKEVMIALLKAFLTPIQTLHALFIGYRTEVVNEITYTSQTLALQELITAQLSINVLIVNAFLNIEISKISRAVLSKRAPLINRASQGNTLSMSRASEIEASQALFNFSVHVPVGFTDDDTLIALINKYKVTGVTYVIIKDLQ